MADPFTASFIAANCVWGAIRGLSGQAAGAAAKRVAKVLREQQTPDNHEMLDSTHTALVRSIQLMADACRKSGGDLVDRYSADALTRLARGSDFASSRFAEGILPKEELDGRIRAIYQGEEKSRAISAANAVIAQIENSMRTELSETHRQLFRHGSDKHRSWPEAFELFFADEVRNNKHVFRMLAVDRLNEIVAFAEAHRSDLSELHEQLGRVREEMHDRFNHLEAMIAQQAGVPLATMRVIAAGFGDELQPGADAAVIETYLRQKASEYRDLKDRLVAIEARDNSTRVLLQQAQECIDAGRFEEADARLAEAEANDEQIGRELRLAADQRDRGAYTQAVTPPLGRYAVKSRKYIVCVRSVATGSESFGSSYRSIQVGPRY